MEHKPSPAPETAAAPEASLPALLPTTGSTPTTRHRPGKARRDGIKGNRLSPRVRQAVELMVHHGKPRKAAAEAVGIKDVTLRNAFLCPTVLRFYNEQLEVLRTSARPRALRQIARLSRKAASEKVQLDASKYLDGKDKAGGTSVVVNVGVAVAPGYLVDMGAEANEARQIAQLAGSTSNALDRK